MKLFYYKFEYLEPDILQFATEQYVGLYKTTLLKTLEYAQRYTDCVITKSQHLPTAPSAEADIAARECRGTHRRILCHDKLRHLGPS